MTDRRRETDNKRETGDVRQGTGDLRKEKYNTLGRLFGASERDFTGLKFQYNKTGFILFQVWKI